MLLSPSHIKRGAAIAAVMNRHGLTHLVVASGLGAALGFKPSMPKDEDARTNQASRLVDALEELGPTFVKVGQFLSTRPDLVPPEYIVELRKLQDNAQHVPFADVRRIVEHELGLTLKEAYAEFSEKPRAAASLAQVHDAVLHSGEPVVVKVQRPGVADPIQQDLSLLHSLAAWMAEHSEAGRLYDLPGVVRELDASLQDELNYRIEAGAMRLFAKNLREFEQIRIPVVYDDLSSRRVITMERVDGLKVTAYQTQGHEAHAAALAREFVEAYLKQIAIDGAVHCDPHAGNVRVDENGRLVLMDFGMVVYLDEKTRAEFVRLLISYAEGDAYHAAETLLDISTLRDDADVDGFRNEVSHVMARDQHMPPAEAMGGLVLLQMTQVAFRRRILVPSTTTLLGKTLLSMSSIAQHLNPSLDLAAVTRDYLSSALLQDRIRANTPGRAFRSWGEWEETLTYAPMRVNRLLDVLSENRLQVRVVTDETETLVEGLQKVANRVAFGIIDAGIIVGSALTMQYHIGPSIGDFPMVAGIGFILAMALGFWLLVSIVVQDRKR
ncbi:MAG TPA: AarF/UbiB family protein [Armatimonadota bacterium]|jgi:predicted unusual protein kinase regulating ubiquinone biosynthesis (AarF/ABC1/UbiB family)